MGLGGLGCFRLASILAGGLGIIYAASAWDYSGCRTYIGMDRSLTALC